MIGFATPWVLAGLGAAAIPILLHLLARRDPPTVVFPAVRYLGQTAQHLRRKVSLQHWLLLLLRTLIIAGLVLAAAGPTLAGGGVPGAGGHAPAGLVVILDNSVSSGAIRDGTPTLDALRATAERILRSAGPADELMLITADGIARRGDRSTLLDLLDSLRPSERRMDLGQAITLARDAIGAGTLPGEMVLLSDLQATAVTPADPGAVPLLVAHPGNGAPRNTGAAGFESSPEPWTADGGLVSVRLAGLAVGGGGGGAGAPVPLSLQLSGSPPRQLLGDGPFTSALRLKAPPGWHLLRAELSPDELRADDVYATAIRISDPARVTWDPGDRWVATALDVLAANGRITPGSDITFGHLGAGVSIVTPPDDPALLGALNRALGARGVPWRYGTLVADAARVDSGAVPGTEILHRRYALVPQGGAGQGIVATVNGDPWLVQAGTVVLIGSRLEPDWTDLPVAAAFVPFLDALLNRIARGEVVHIQAAPGAPAFLPDRATAIRSAEDDREWRVEGGAPWTPPGRGVYFVLAEQDTLGTVAANVDERESDLRVARAGLVRDLWSGARVVDLEDAPGRVFAAGARADLRGPVLWIVLVIALTEMALARGRREKA